MEHRALIATEQVHFWRHPKPADAQGLCVGCADVRCDPRKTRRLASRIRQRARKEKCAPIVITSPLSRCADVGRWLARWGWTHIVDPQLREMDFGQWNGRSWAAIGQAEIDTWCAQFLDFAPGGGESLRALLTRVNAWQAPPGAAIVVCHAGWIEARRWRLEHGDALPAVSQWSTRTQYGQCFTQTGG